VKDYCHPSYIEGKQGLFHQWQSSVQKMKGYAWELPCRNVAWWQSPPDSQGQGHPSDERARYSPLMA